MNILQALSQQTALTFLGKVHHTVYGNYDLKKLSLPEELKPHLSTFQSTLQNIEKEIIVRNKMEIFAYDFLRPSTIPQSINVWE